MIVDVPNKSFSIILSNIDCASNEPPASCSNLDSYSLFKVFELVEFFISLSQVDAGFLKSDNLQYDTLARWDE